MAGDIERLYPRSGDNSLKTGLSFYRYIADVGALQVSSQGRLAKEGVIWYPVGSLFVPFFQDLSGKKLPKEHYPLISRIWEYARQTDDLFDNSVIMPSWQETNLAVAPTQKRLFDEIRTADISVHKKGALFREIAQLRKRAYDAFARQHAWEGPVSFDEAFQYRRDSSILLMRKIAAMGNILVDTPEEKGLLVEDGFEAIGIPLQVTDDLMDIEDDKVTDGNLIHAALYEHDEDKKFADAIQGAQDGTNYLRLLSSVAPKTTQFVLGITDRALVHVEEMSPRVANAVRICTQIVFDISRTSKDKKGFAQRFTNEMHRKV